VQTLLSTDYDYWATRRRGYGSAKEHVAQSGLGAIERQIPGVSAAVKMIASSAKSVG
jgi:hypothetical protein